MEMVNSTITKIVQRFKSLPISTKRLVGLGTVLGLFIALPLFVWAIVTQTFLVNQKAASGEPISGEPPTPTPVETSIPTPTPAQSCVGLPNGFRCFWRPVCPPNEGCPQYVGVGVCRNGACVPNSSPVPSPVVSPTPTPVNYCSGSNGSECHITVCQVCVSGTYCPNHCTLTPGTCQNNYCIGNPGPSPTPVGTPVGNSIEWTTNYVSLTASNFYINLGSKGVFLSNNNVNLHSDPGNSDYTTLEATWQEKGVEMRLFMYFSRDISTNIWKVYDLRTYNGNSSGDWIDYPGFNGVVADHSTPLYLANVNFYSTDGTSYVHFENFYLQPNFSQQTPTPSISCNRACTTNNDCANGLICYNDSCRNPSCATNTDCSCTTSPTSTPTPVIGDVNGDGLVNIVDIGLIVDNYKKTGSPGFIPEDLNNDGVVNIVDLGIVIDHYQF